MFANQAEDFAPNKVGTTAEERKVILEAYREHRMTGKSIQSFSMHAHQTLKRVAERHSDFSKSLEQIDRDANAHLENILISKMNDDDKPINLRAFELLTRNRKYWKPEPEEAKDIAPVRIEIVGITNREEADDFRQNEMNGSSTDIQTK